MPFCTAERKTGNSGYNVWSVPAAAADAAASLSVMAVVVASIHCTNYENGGNGSFSTSLNSNSLT